MKRPQEGQPMSEVTHFGQAPSQSGPYVDPNVTNPAAVRYAQQARQRRENALPKYDTPVAGGDAPRIPNLGGEPVLGIPMAAQVPVMPQAPPRSGIIADPAAMGAMPIPGGVGLPPGIQNGDLLPEEATRDPAFRAGTGAMIAGSQPSLAYKYGVVRKGVRLAPQQLRANSGPQRQLSQETMKGLEDLNHFNQTRAAAESGNVDASIRAEAAAGPAGQSSEVGGGTGKKLTDEEKRELLESVDDLDMNKIRNVLLRDMLNNDEQKKLIEARLKPLDITELILKGRVTQIVPIKPGQFEPEYQSYSGEEDLVLKRLIATEAGKLILDERYYLDKFSLMGLALSVRAINKVQFPHYENAEGEFDEELFWAKYKRVTKLPYHMISSLYANWFWFDIRVRKLFVAEELGNG